eukprot:TRINITY_DN1420_c0_g1_i2.p1 TRINITY_DN1420_c0_g1~~TRINITY_DN1420_c0_g1_i2.p1  ORF type:complete len:268 (-),score=56.73 TRINITY_DN1420_c0_g1_i2:231-1034(-)
MCVTFTKKATNDICRELRGRRTVKTYVAIVHGMVMLSKLVEKNGISAETSWGVASPHDERRQFDGEKVRSIQIRTFVVTDPRNSTTKSGTGVRGRGDTRGRENMNVGGTFNSEDNKIDCNGVIPSLTQFLTSNDPAHKEAITSLAVLGYGTYKNQIISHVLLKLHTGRRHQIRLHCCYIGHPIVGDLVYRNESCTIPNKIPNPARAPLPISNSPTDGIVAERTMLHALSFEISIQGKKQIWIAEDPLKFLILYTEKKKLPRNAEVPI